MIEGAHGVHTVISARITDVKSKDFLSRLQRCKHTEWTLLTEEGHSNLMVRTELL